MTQQSVPQRVALTLPNPRGIEATIEQAVWGEQQGYDDVWFGDASGIDSLSTAVAVAGRTNRVRIGTAIVPVYTRTPAVLASSAHVLHQVSGGRFILGLGCSSHVIMEQWNGVKLTRPLTRVKETLQLARGILAGEKTSFDGETVSSHGYRQLPLPAGVPPIYVAALRGKMLEMAAEFSDGVIINNYPRTALPKIMHHIGLGAGRAGKTLSQVEVVCRHIVMVTDDRPAAREAFRAAFAPYFATPVYNHFLEWAGYPEVARTIREGWAAKDRSRTNGAFSDALVDEIAIIGSAAECHDWIRWYAAQGVTTHIISCPPPALQAATYAAFTRDRFRL